MDAIMEAAKTGLGYERQRIELATQRLALANVPFSSKSDALAALQNTLGAQSSVQANTIKQAPEGIEIKIKQSPDHPQADANGFVYFIAIEPSAEMTTLVSATRAYEANVRSYNTWLQMQNKSLEIGGRR